MRKDCDLLPKINQQRLVARVLKSWFVSGRCGHARESILHARFEKARPGRSKGSPLLLLLSREAADQIRFLLAIRLPVRMQYFVEPHRRLIVDIWVLPRFPRQVRLRLAHDEPPVDRAWLIPDVPAKNAVVLCKGTHNSLHVSF